MNTTLMNENMYQLLLSAKDSVGILLFQMILNVFGTVDYLPFTGVTFPFLSNGGSSMMSGGAREMKTVIKRTRFWETAVTIWYVWRRHFWC